MATGEKQADDSKEVGDPKEADSRDAGLKNVPPPPRPPPPPPAACRPVSGVLPHCYPVIG